MIRRFMRDPDEVMEVYTAICERLRANEYKALVKFRTNSDLMPWLSVVAANACRDRLRKRRASSVPRSVLSKLDDFEQLVFKYYYWRRLPHEDIAEIIKSNHGVPCTPLEVVDSIAKINDLLSVNKRWLLLVALNANQPTLSIDEMAENGFQPHDPDSFGHVDEALRNRDRLDRLSEAMSHLGREDQLLVLLRYEHGMTAPQIADVMHYDSHKHVYTRLRTVIGRLRRSLVE
jgi:DNA-directed RNA polymerase specialized sigma24 family protein